MELFERFFLGIWGQIAESPISRATKCPQIKKIFCRHVGTSGDRL